jgi:membrane-bound lytic murein transglycosylase F
MKVLGTLFLGILVFFYSSEESLLDKIKERGELRVVTRYGLSTYYEGPNGKAGLEYELAKRFADSLGVELRLLVSNNFDDILQLVTSQHAHLAAAGLINNDASEASIRFGPHYQIITQQLVYRRDFHKPPTELEAFGTQHQLVVVANSNSVHYLKQLKSRYPNLVWQEVSGIKPSELLEQVWEKQVHYAVVDSNEVTQMRRFYPELEVGLQLPAQQKLAWAFPRSSGDNTLYLEAIQFFNRLERSGELEQLIERYYGHLDDVENFNYINFRAFHRHIETRLPKYQAYFEKMGEHYQLDWRLLAAVGYQESQWDPGAVSATGVRGLMMLTQATAEEMGVTNREDPFESIKGGTKYLIWLKKQIVSEITEPDRTWFTLAAYNVGLGHLRDAQLLTQQLKGNPNHWVDVKENLPKLSDPYWYEQTEYGHARGHEPVQFVKNIRRFYDILVRLFPLSPKSPQTTSLLSEQIMPPISLIPTSQSMLQSAMN